MRYKGIEIDLNLSGWYSAFIIGISYLKADTLKGIKNLIKEMV